MAEPAPNLEFLEPFLNAETVVGPSSSATVDPSSPATVAPETTEKKALSAQQQAERIKLLLDAGLDAENNPIIWREFGKPKIGEGAVGFVGSPIERGTREDIFPKEVEKLLDPKYLKLLEEYYGAPEVSVPREDADLLEKIRTYLIGRDPSESESQAERTASIRGGSADFVTRYLLEKLGGVQPSDAAVRGAADADASPAEKALLAKFGYKPVTDAVTQDLEMRLYARAPLRNPEAFKELTKNANEAIRLLAELPAGETKEGKKYSVAEDIVGQILLTDINAKYGTPNKQYTLDDLKLRMDPSAAGRRLTFKHPDGEGRQAIDPVTFEWGDVLDQLPGAYVILADVLGSIGGGVAGSFASPIAGTFLGATAGGALSAMLAKYLVMNEGLKKGGFVFDSSKGGWSSQKSGKEQFIPLTSIMDDTINEGLWSAGGAVLGSTVFRLAKAIFSKGGSEAESFVRKDDWDDAYRRWGENKFGKKFEAEGIPSSPALILENASRELREAAQNVTGKERDELLKRANRVDASASQFRVMEKNVLPEAAVARERMLGSLEEGTRTIDGKVIKPADYDDVANFGRQAEEAIKSGDATRINNLLESMNAANSRLIDDWDAAFAGAAEEGTEALFGQNIRAAANKVLGTIDGKTASQATDGIYGTLNKVRDRAAQYNRPKAWNIKKVSDYVEKEIGALGKEFKGGASAFSPELKGLFKSLRDRVGKEGDLSINYAEMRQLINAVDDEIGKASGDNARRLYRVQEMLRIAEGRGIKNVDSDLYKEWATAQKQFKEFRSVWAKQFEQGLTDLNTDQLANKFLKSMNDDKTVTEVLGSFRNMGLYGKEQEDLLRNVLKSRLRSVLTKELGPSEGVEIAGKTQTVKIGDTRFGTESLSGAKLNQFLNEYGPWVRQLFPNDPQLSEFASKVARSETLKGRYDKIARMERNLKNLPFLRDFSTTDLQKLAIDEPHKLYDLVWQSGRPSIENTASVKELNRILKRGLEPEEFALAQERLKALTLRKIWNPDDDFAAAATAGRPVSARDVTPRSIDFLNRERSALIEIFGEKHVKNMQALFKEMEAVANPRDMGMAGVEITRRKGGPVAQLAGIVAKVWVGVLNRKARALNLGQKFARGQDEVGFLRLLQDPKALDRALKIRSSKVGRLSANALGSALFLNDDEIQELLDDYTMTDSQGRRQPVPVQTREESISEAVDNLIR